MPVTLGFRANPFLSFLLVTAPLRNQSRYSPEDRPNDSRAVRSSGRAVEVHEWNDGGGMMKLKNSAQLAFPFFCDPTPDCPFDDVPDDLWCKFVTFDRANPEVKRYFVDRCYDLVRCGRTRAGMAELYEPVRWQHATARCPGQRYKLDNNFRRIYALVIMKENPALDGLFEIRSGGWRRSRRSLAVRPVPNAPIGEMR